MFHLDHDYDPIAPCGAELLAEFGLDARAVRDALADDLARRCPTAKSRLTGAGAKRVKGEREEDRERDVPVPPARQRTVIIEIEGEPQMAFGMNRVELIGRLGADVAVNHLVSGGRVANLSVATDDTYINRQTGEKVDRTEWHRLVTFQDGLIDMLEKHARKGRLVHAEGKLQTRRWKKDGEGSDRLATEILVVPGHRLQFLDKAQRSQQREGRGGTGGRRDRAGRERRRRGLRRLHPLLGGPSDLPPTRAAARAVAHFGAAGFESPPPRGRRLKPRHRAPNRPWGRAVERIRSSLCCSPFCAAGRKGPGDVSLFCPTPAGSRAVLSPASSRA